MTTRTVLAGDLRYTFHADDTEPDARRTQLICRARLIDETTGAPPRSRARVQVADRRTLGHDWHDWRADARLATRALDDGIIGVIGRPWVHTHPLHDGRMPIAIRIEAPGFLPRMLDADVSFDLRRLVADAVATTDSVDLDDRVGLQPGDRLLLGPAGSDHEELVEIAALGPGANQLTLTRPLHLTHPAGAFVAPGRFRALELGDVELRRAPIAIHGRTLRRTAVGYAAVPNATIELTAVYRRPPGVGGGPAFAATLVALEPPLAIDRRSIDGRITRRALPLDAAVTTKRLSIDARAGERSLRLSDLAGLAAGDVLSVDAESGARSEFVRVAALMIDREVRVDLPLVRPHRVDARVRRLSPQVPGAVKNLAVDATAGDPCVFVNDAIGLADLDTVESTDGAGAPSSFHRVRLFRATSDADGNYRLPPLTRVGMIELTASAPALASDPREHVPDYSAGEERLDFLFE